MAMDFTKNPFEGLGDLGAILGGAAGGGGQPPQQGPAMPPQGMVQGMTGNGKPVPVATERGQNPGISRYATQALSSVQNMLAESTDPQEIAMIRAVVSMLTKLIQQDQDKQGKSAGAPTPPPGMPPGMPGLPTQ